ncbi:hypothetical protein HYX08_02335 [Candidatus Woesearchaeota archaeon]|nr:hypothetical protein [Candidatus Woesearchaeota archaeon]
MAIAEPRTIDDVARGIPTLSPRELGIVLTGHNSVEAMSGKGKAPSVGIYEVSGKLYLINRVNGDINVYGIGHVENSSIPKLTLVSYPVEREKALKAYLRHEAGLI